MIPGGKPRLQCVTQFTPFVSTEKAGRIFGVTTAQNRTRDISKRTEQKKNSNLD